MNYLKSPTVSFKYRHQFLSILKSIDVVGFRYLANILPQVLIPKAKGPVQLQILEGQTMWLDPVLDKGVERQIYYTGTYEQGTLSIIKSILASGDTFVDIGANIGLMSIIASTAVGESGQVYSFEPNPETHNILKRNISINNLNNVILSSYAVGAQEGEGLIYDLWDKNRGSATLVPQEGQSDGHKVLIKPLIQLIPNWAEIDLIKIDVEGFEIEVLKGLKEVMISNNPPKLIVECSDRRANKEGLPSSEIFTTIIQTGNYDVFKTKGSKARSVKLIPVHTADDLPFHDNLYCFPKATR